MKKTTVVAALSLAFTANVFAANPIEQSLNQGLVVAITEPGTVAADTAWLLSNQAAEGRDIPVLVVLKPETRTQTLNALKLEQSDLPAIVFLDLQGKERGRLVGAAPANKDFEKNRLGTLSLK